MLEAVVPTGRPGQVSRDEPGPVHGPLWMAIALQPGWGALRGVFLSVAVRSPINDRLRTGTDNGNPTV